MQPKKIFLILFFIILIGAIICGLFVPIAMDVFAMGPHPFLPDEEATRATTDIMFGTGLVMVFSSAYFICSPLLGLYSDIHGRSKVFKIYFYCALFSYIFILLGINIKSIDIILFGTVLQSISCGILPIIQAATADIASGKKRVIYFGMINAAMGFLILAAEFCNYLLRLDPTHTNHQVNIILLMMTVLSAIGLMLTILFVPETKKKQIVLNPVINSAVILRNLSKVFYKTETRWLLFLLALFQFSWGLYFQDIYVYLIKIANMSSTNASLFISFTIIVFIVTLFFLFPLLIKYFATQKLLIFSFILCYIGMLGINWVNVSYISWLLIIPFAVGVAMINPILWGQLSTSVNHTQYGFLMGIIGALWAFTWALSDLVGDKLNDYYFSLPLVIALVMMIACLQIYLTLSRRLANSTKRMLRENNNENT